MILITLISALISSAFGQSRYILSYYTLPDFSAPTDTTKSIQTLSPFPIDQCVIYQVQLDLAAWFTGGGLIKSYYGKFECTTTSTTDDTVIFTDYGTDSTCLTPDNTNNATYYPNAASGAEGNFECSGENNYLSIDFWVISGDVPEDGNGRDLCCDNDNLLGIFKKTFVTGICFGADNDYSIRACNATQTLTTFYNDSACSNQVTKDSNVTGDFDIGLIDATSSFCQALDGSDDIIPMALFAILNECVIDGNTESVDDYCPYIAPSSAPTTADPTTTNPTSNPTAITANPTPITVDPTADPTSDPTSDPTNDPSPDPTNDPTQNPTNEPTTDAPSIKLDEAGGEVCVVKHLIILVLYMAAWMN